MNRLIKWPKPWEAWGLVTTVSSNADRLKEPSAQIRLTAGSSVATIAHLSLFVPRLENILPSAMLSGMLVLEIAGGIILGTMALDWLRRPVGPYEKPERKPVGRGYWIALVVAAAIGAGTMLLH